MLVPMSRVEMVAPRSRGDALVRSLHRAACVQLVPFEPRSALAASVFSSSPPGSPGRRAATLLDEIMPLGDALAARRAETRAPAAVVAELWGLDAQALRDRVKSLAPTAARVADLLARYARHESEAARMAGYRRIVEALRPMVGRLPALRGFGSTAIIVHARYRGVLGLVRDELEALTDSRFEMVASDISGERVAALVVYPLDLADQVRAALGSRDLEELTLPTELSGLPFPELIDRLHQREAEARADRQTVDRELDAVADQYAAKVLALQMVLRDRVAEGRALASAGTSDHLLLLSGWVPSAQLGDLRRRLAEEIGAEVQLEEVAFDRQERELAPVAVQNPPLLQAFAPLAAFVSLPRYGTIDPTPLLAASFPIFVGMMVGDVGYGAVALALLGLSRWRWPHSTPLRTLTPVALLAGLSTVVFGVLFGEWFGAAGQQIFGIQPLLFDRAEAITTFLLIALAIGAGQVGIGLLLGIVNAALQGHRREVYGRVGLLATLAATLVILGWLAGIIPPSGGHLALALLAIALAVLIASLGIAGPIEAIGVLGNVLSYARLMAIGMASVMLALVANSLGGIVGNVVIGLIVAGLLHGVNLVLGFFDATVQGLRLHYVEFFSKFVEPGGTRYEPFASVLTGLVPELAVNTGASHGGS